jgi:hypothetical protein
MSASDDLLNLLTCSYCKRVYEKPVILPCKNKICKNDLLGFLTDSHSNNARTYQCPFCDQNHVETLDSDGFPEDHRLMRVIELSMEQLELNSDTAKQAANSCQKFNELNKEFKNLLQNPNSYIEDFFKKLRLKVESNRNENKEIIDKFYDHILGQVNGLEMKCKDCLKTDEFCFLYNENDFYSNEKQINDWLHYELKSNKNDNSRLDYIKHESKKMENNLELKLKNLKTNLLANQIINFEERLLDPAQHNLFGKLNVCKLNSIFRINSEKDYSNVMTSRNSSRERVLESQISVQLNSPVRFHLNHSEEESELDDTLPEMISNSQQDAYSNNKKHKSKNLYLVLFDYEAKTKDELTIKRGDILKVHESDKSRHGVWLASFHEKTERRGVYESLSQASNRRKSLLETFSRQNSVSKGLSNMTNNLNQSGFVFSNYVDDYSQVENENWFCGRLNRADAESILKSDANKAGSFLVRMCDAKVGSHIYSLSVRNENNEIKHYKIIREFNDQREALYHIYHANIEKVKIFKSLGDLIAYYKLNRAGLCCTLNSECSAD